MSSIPQAGGDVDMKEASSEPPTIGDSDAQEQHHHHRYQEQQQQHPPQQQQQQQQLLHAGNSISSTSTPHQPLFPKPHPSMLSSFSTTTADMATSNPSTIGTSSPPKSPLAILEGGEAAAALSAATPLHHPHPHNPHFAKGEGVEEPLPTDVICGRGKMTASHPANRRFRELVDSHKASYQNSKRRDEKTRITCELVDKLRGEGRFVLFDPSTKLWHEVSEEYAREKVSHSLRSRSSTEQRIANAASNSIKMLNNAVHHENNDTVVVNIAPRTTEEMECISGDNSPLSSTAALEGTTAPTVSKNPNDSGVPSSPNDSSSINNNHKNSIDKLHKKSKINHLLKSLSGSSGSGGSKSKLANSAQQLPHRKKTSTATTNKAASPHKANSSSTSSSARSKHHAVLKPDLDEIVKRLIKDQQAFLRMMIQKETERFTSAAALGGGQTPRPPMPLSYKAEASAVSTLTASLPKMGEQRQIEPSTTAATATTAGTVITTTVGAPQMTVATTATTAGSSPSKGASPDETPSSLRYCAMQAPIQINGDIKMKQEY